MKHDAKTAQFKFGQPMNPCSICGGYDLVVCAPIQIDISKEDGAKEIMQKWAKTHQNGGPFSSGPVYIMCHKCKHRGPAVDCAGWPSDEIMKDKAVFDAIKKLWNEQAVEESKEAEEN